MKRKNTILILLFSLLCVAAAAQNDGGSSAIDPRTLLILQRVQESEREIESLGPKTSRKPVKAVSITKTETLEEPAGKPRRSEAADERKGRQRRATASSDNSDNQSNGDKTARDVVSPSLRDIPEAVQQTIAATQPRVQQSTLPQPSLDTLYLSTEYTTHIIFSSDISYANLSNTEDIAGQIVETAKNKLALKATVPFTSSASLSVEESGGKFRTFILKYATRPRFLIVDTREGADMWALTKLDTVYLSTLYTSHIIFNSDVIYNNVSHPDYVMGRLVDQGKNKLAITARNAFEGTASLSIEEANGVFHTYIIAYADHPKSLVKDTREEYRPIVGSITGSTDRDYISGSYLKGSSPKTLSDGNAGLYANNLKRSDAPTLANIIDRPQGLFHLSTKKYKIRLTCENIYSYSDIIYMTFRLDNDSGISYEVSDATFVVESNNGSKRKIVSEENIFPKNRAGSLTTQPGSTAKICYSFDKMSLSSDQLLKVYLYENSGQRNLVLPVSYKDINSAIRP